MSSVRRLLYHEENKEGHPIRGTDTDYVRRIMLSRTITLHYAKRILLNQASQFTEESITNDKTYCLLLVFRLILASNSSTNASSLLDLVYY